MQLNENVRWMLVAIGTLLNYNVVFTLGYSKHKRYSVFEMHTLGTITSAFVLARARGITNIINTPKLCPVTCVRCYTRTTHARKIVSYSSAHTPTSISQLYEDLRAKNVWKYKILLIQSNKYNRTASFYCIVALSIRFGQQNNFVSFLQRIVSFSSPLF